MRTLGQVMTNLPVYEFQPECIYKLFAPNVARDEEYISEDPAMILCVPLDEPVGYVPEQAANANLVSIIDYETLRSIITVALDMKPDCNDHDLVKSLNYYLYHDGFYDFDE